MLSKLLLQQRVEHIRIRLPGLVFGLQGVPDVFQHLVRDRAGAVPLLAAWRRDPNCLFCPEVAPRKRLQVRLAYNLG